MTHRRSELVRKLIRPGRKLEVLDRDSSRIMRLEGQGYATVPDENVGMVVEAFGLVRDLRDELHRLHEVLELIGSLDGISDMNPFGYGLQRRFNLLIREFRHGALRKNPEVYGSIEPRRGLLILSDQVRKTRLAPSPTGALHLGNARTFLINWAVARRNGWRIVLRIEDLDGPRIKPGAIELTIDLLRWLGIDWDEGPIVQSHDLSPYQSAMRALAQSACAYPSDATRTQVEESASAPQEGTTEIRFSADLRPALLRREFDEPDRSWRFATPQSVVSFEDRIAGPQSIDPSSSVGDFVIWTKRNQPAYQLAVVVDDARQGITDIIRGDDLIDSAARQLLIYRALGLTPEPRYFHVPLVRGEDGRRLAKRHGDSRLDSYRSAGVSPERIIGLIASWCDPLRPPQGRHGMSAREFLESFELDKMSKESIVFTGKDHQWLLRS